jgi:hypothetical protein
MSYTREELDEAGLLDFRIFLFQVWDHLGLPEPTPVQLAIAYYLQHGPKRQIIQAFRGVGKSWITVAFCLWNLLLDPEMKVMMVSASQHLADDASKFARQLIDDMPLLQHLQPRRDQRQSALSFDVGPSRPSKDPSLKSAGITGQITGSRADLIVGDDVEVPRNALTHGMREKLAETVKEFDAILKPDGRVVYLGTPQVEATLYRKLLGRGYETRIWPSEVPEKPHLYSGNLAPFIQKMIDRGDRPGTPTDPKRFSKTDLMERKASYGLTGFALQFMLDTTPASADSHPLKTKDLIIHDLDPEMAPVKLVWGQGKDEKIEGLESGGFDGDFYTRPAWQSDEMAKYQGTVCYIDPSASGKDETAYAIVRYAHGMLFLADVGGYKDGFSEETLRGIAGAIARHGVNYWVSERNYGGGMFDQLLTPVVRSLCNAAQDTEWKAWSTGAKEWRILDVLEPVIQNHRLVVDRRVIQRDLLLQQDKESYSLVQQMTRMARLKGCLPHDDRLEAVAGAVRYWTERMARDTQKTLKQHKERLLEEELRRFGEGIMPGAFGGQDLVWRKRPI